MIQLSEKTVSRRSTGTSGEVIKKVCGMRTTGINCYGEDLTEHNLKIEVHYKDSKAALTGFSETVPSLHPWRSSNSIR